MCKGRDKDQKYRRLNIRQSKKVEIGNLDNTGTITGFLKQSKVIMKQKTKRYRDSETWRRVLNETTRKLKGRRIRIKCDATALSIKIIFTNTLHFPISLYGHKSCYRIWQRAGINNPKRTMVLFALLTFNRMGKALKVILTIGVMQFLYPSHQDNQVIKKFSLCGVQM